MAKDKEKDSEVASEEPVDSSKIQIRRVAGLDPLVELSYLPFYRPEQDTKPHSNTAAIWHPDPALAVFEVGADIATAAVATGHFEVTESSRVKLKGVPK
jgi:hypothetical protein